MFENLSFLPLLGRALFAVVFIWAAINKINGVAFYTNYINSRLFAGDVIVWLTIIFEIAVGVLIIAGWKFRWVAAAALVFLFLTAFIFHPWWTFPEKQQFGQWVNFWKNMSMAGAACFFMYFGAGPMALDSAAKVGKTD